MKFLLAAINAKYIHSNPAIYSLKAYAGETLGAHVELAEYTINQRTEEILADLYQRRPDVIGFSCYIWNRNQVEALLPEVAKVLPNTEIWLGGPEVSYETDEIFARFPQIRGIMVGEGEETFRELLAYYVDGANPEKSPEPEKLLEPEKPMHPQKSLTEIAGLALPEGRTAPRDEMDMNEVPFLYEDLSLFENRILYYETSRGCPYRCSYCLSSVEKRVRFRKMEEIFKHLQFFLDHKVKQVKFVDRTFNCDRKHADAIWTYLKEHDNGITNFHFEISADILQEEEIALLRSMRPGLVQLEIGVQSCNEDTLQAINRRMQLDELEKIVAAIKEGGNVHQHLDLIAGLPYENLESFKQSFNRVYRVRPDQLQLGFLKLLKGTNMYAQREEYGIVHGEKPPYEVLYTKWITYEELLLLKRVEEMVERYYNSGQFVQTLSVIERAFDSPFALYEKLAAFYEEKKLFLNNPSRMYRYQVLLEFAQRYDEKNAPLYRELLTYDLYLRENSMSRPPFGTDIYRFKENIREYYQAEDGPDRSTTHIEPFTYPVWDLHCLAQGGVASMEDPHFVLFDYAKRSPLDHSARICLLHFGKTGQDSCKSEETTV